MFSALSAKLDTSTMAFGLDDIRATTLRLLSYCQDRGWAGYDPYDALNSRLLKALPFLDFRLFRLALTQLVKRCPFNLRPLLLIPPGQNPKGLALFVSALLKLNKLGLVADAGQVNELIIRLKQLRAAESRYWCWGYHFPWQSRSGLFPLGMPNIICTTFVGNALLDAHEAAPNAECLQMAASAARFIQDVLYYEENNSAACYSYTPLARSKVHNASLLGAAFLVRLGKISGAAQFREPALKAARFSIGCQRPDGSWPYGEHPTQQWIDNFHTGYNLCALRSIARQAGTAEFDSAIHRGFAYYRQNFFLDDGTPKYYHDRTYPVDIHSAAQSIITLLEFRDLGQDSQDLAHTVCQWANHNLWDTRGFYHFQKHPFYTNRISFMRWSQAWMLLALSFLLAANHEPRTTN